MYSILWKAAALAAVGGCASIPPPGDSGVASSRGGTMVSHDSAWLGYQAFNPAEPLLDWRTVNEAVRQAGGHLGLMRSAKPDAAPALPSGERSGHGGHVPSAPKEPQK